MDRVVDMVPELVDKITDFVEKQKEKKDTQDSSRPSVVIRSFFSSSLPI